MWDFGGKNVRKVDVIFHGVKYVGYVEVKSQRENLKYSSMWALTRIKFQIGRRKKVG